MARTGELSDLITNYPATTLDGTEALEILQSANNYGVTLSTIISDLSIAKESVANSFAIGQSITANSASDKPLILKGASSQTGNLLELQDNSSTMLSRFKYDGTLEVAGGGGTSSTASLKFLNSSSVNPIIQWNPHSGSTGIKFFSNTTEVARIQDNGACYFGSIATLGDFRLFDYGFSRGANGGKLTLRYGDGPTFDYTAVDTTTTSFVRWTNPTAANPIAIFKGASSQSGDSLQVVNSSNTVLSAIKADGSWKPPSMADSSATNNSVYYSTTASKLVYKDSGGTVNGLY